MKRLIRLFIFLFLVMTMLLAQSATILSGQMKAIKILAERQGFSDKEFDRYLIKEYNKLLDQLSREQGAELITKFQSENPPQPPGKPAAAATTITRKEAQNTVIQESRVLKPQNAPVLADVLEVGMEKQFHLIDENILYGKIVKVDAVNCHIESNGSVLMIPKSDILSETAVITKKDRTRFTGTVLNESTEDFKLRTRYGDITIHKRDIRDMDRYHGGQKTEMKEDIHKFYRGEAQLVNNMDDPTAFVLEPQTFYVSGMSVGYGFTDRFMLTTKFGSSFSGDLNIHPKINLFHYEDGITEHGVTLGLGIHRRYQQRRLVGQYSQAIEHKESDTPLNEIDTDMEEVMLEPDKEALYNEVYIVYSKRQSLKSGRGKVGYSLGAKTNSLAWDKPELTDDYQWIENSEFKIPFRLWFAFEYDLRKNLKFVGTIWMDNGNKSRTLRQSINDYFQDDTPFIFDNHEGTYSIVDFDFGFLYAVNDNLRVGVHFQDPFFEFYWEFFEF